MYTKIYTFSHINFTCKSKFFLLWSQLLKKKSKQNRTIPNPKNGKKWIGLPWSYCSFILNVRYLSGCIYSITVHMCKTLDPSETMSGLESIAFIYSFMQSVGAWLSWKVYHLDFTVTYLPFKKWEERHTWLCLIEWHLIDLVSQCEARFNLY